MKAIQKKPIKITILEGDWKPGIDYQKPCGCLLFNAAFRQLGERVKAVWVGDVAIIGSAGWEFWTYAQSRVERRLKLAHKYKSLLPMTITIKPPQ